MTTLRRLGNLCFTLSVRALFGGRYTNLCYGYSTFWRKVMPVLNLDGDGFEMETQMNICALRAGLKVVEIPSLESHRVHDIGRLQTLPDGWRVLKTIIHEWCDPSVHGPVSVDRPQTMVPAAPNGLIFLRRRSADYGIVAGTAASDPSPAPAANRSLAGQVGVAA
jgi:hypothetical protein